jgi:hypothetical protein
LLLIRLGMPLAVAGDQKMRLILIQKPILPVAAQKPLTVRVSDRKELTLGRNAVLDLGCGPGLFLPASEMDLRVSGVDFLGFDR